MGFRALSVGRASFVDYRVICHGGRLSGLGLALGLLDGSRACIGCFSHRIIDRGMVQSASTVVYDFGDTEPTAHALCVVWFALAEFSKQMTTENKRKQLIFRSWHRGTREMDLLLGSFADANVNSFTETELEEYAKLLEESDPDLYDWFTKQKPVPANATNGILEKFLKHKLK